MMLLRQILFQLVLFSRRPVALFFVIAMPVIMLGLLTQLLGNDPIPGQSITTAQFYTPSLAVFGVVSACYTYLAISTATSRDQGILKRIRGTPLPPAVYISARIVSVTVIALAAALLVVACGVAFLEVDIQWDKAAAGFIVVLVGGVCFAAMGLMVVALCGSSETVQAAVNATLLPLAFLSEIFIRPGRELPAWMEWTGDIFPLKHFSVAFGEAFKPSLEGYGFAWNTSDDVFSILPELLVMGAWGGISALIAVWFFKWDVKL